LLSLFRLDQKTPALRVYVRDFVGRGNGTAELPQTPYQHPVNNTTTTTKHQVAPLDAWVQRIHPFQCKGGPSKGMAGLPLKGLLKLFNFYPFLFVDDDSRLPAIFNGSQKNIHPCQQAAIIYKLVNSLTAIDAHERQFFDKLLWGLVTSTIFVGC
jgi:hypothetical protein